MGDEEAPVRTERAWFLSAGEESEVRTGADFLAGEISVLVPHPFQSRSYYFSPVGLFHSFQRELMCLLVKVSHFVFIDDDFVIPVDDKKGYHFILLSMSVALLL
jgi:hypothetical protein